ncbi:hypothetical protein R3W88_006469 [Solanum pinnatisectum]|uniref:F-box domain-containing protein n=1 Tax=Solanum pinnatisectum TaxID=50273 RepID=A0AAV9KEU5_9SOLN|nr:hypothetical protein R3W88_006469 [Solanum pinnatisectum]
MDSSSRPLPSDIIFKILTRTSLETLDTCKAVKKEWHEMIFESSFMPQFCANSQNISGYFVQGLFFGDYVSEFVSMDGCSGNRTTTPFHLPRPDELVKLPAFFVDTRIVASTMQGILCCVITLGNWRSRFHICKPSTKQWMKLPSPKMRYFTKKVALIVLRSKPLHFKIIRLSSPPTSQPCHYSKLGLIRHYRCEIFDSEYWRWRQGKDLLLLSLSSFFEPFAPAVHAAGLIYFQLCCGQVIALNYDGEEVFPRLSLPNCPGIDDKYNDGHRLITEYKGKLGCTYLSPNGIKLWVFDNGRQDWELIKEEDIEIIKEEAKYAIPHGFYNADIALMAEGNRVFFYKL